MPPYLLAALSLALADPLALLAETFVMLARLHLIVPACYLIFRALGFQWDGIDAGWRVLCAVHEVRQAWTHEKKVSVTLPSQVLTGEL